MVCTFSFSWLKKKETTKNRKKIVFFSSGCQQVCFSSLSDIHLRSSCVQHTASLPTKPFPMCSPFQGLLSFIPKLPTEHVWPDQAPPLNPWHLFFCRCCRHVWIDNLGSRGSPGVQRPRTGSPLSPTTYLTTTFLVLTSLSSFSRFLCTDLFGLCKKVLTCRPQRTRYALCFLVLSFAKSLPYIPPIPSALFTTLCPHFSLAFTHFCISQTHFLHVFRLCCQLFPVLLAKDDLAPAL